MSTKLIIHKFDSDVHIQTMNITIKDDDATSAVYSDWIESTSEPISKGSKSSRLVVKLVSGSESNYFNLDDCAKENGNNNIYTDSTIEQFALNNRDIHNGWNDQIRVEEKTPEIRKLKKNDLPNCNFIKKESQYNNKSLHSPLEYNLEKVKKINARIMENIHVLNRTLIYTKEKEDMENSCTKSSRSYLCRTCGKCFVYETGLKRHHLLRHSLAGTQPRWQVVWTCTECFQVWPHLDSAQKHSSLCCKTSIDECVKEIKTSLLLQCEFCERVFTSIPCLLKHSKTHTTSKNYECTPCKMSFISYKEAEQHWTNCLFLKASYHFFLLKMLLCNICDRKFKNYEQLYNHR